MDTDQSVLHAAEVAEHKNRLADERSGEGQPSQGVRVYGQPWTQMPEDLFIPPDALEVALESFEGPLDLLLYLIRKQNMDILDIRVAEITRQYMQYIEVMQTLKFELAAEYLVMAAILGEIKSRCLLPRPASATSAAEADPRVELVRRLQEYERIKRAAEALENWPQEGRDFYVVQMQAPVLQRPAPLPDLDLSAMLSALQEVLRRAELYEHHQIVKEALTLRERMVEILEWVQGEEFIEFHRLFRPAEGRMGVVVSFMAVLELIREGILVLVQGVFLAPLYVRRRSAMDAA